MHKRIRPYRRTLSVCDSSNVYRLSLVGTFELTNHFRIRYNIFFDPRCLCNTALTPNGDQFTLPCICSDGLRHHHNIAAKIRNNNEIIHIKAHFYTLFNKTCKFVVRIIRFSEHSYLLNNVFSVVKLPICTHRIYTITWFVT